MTLAPRFLAFCATGGVGFVVDAGILAALVHGAGAGPYAARAVSLALAVTVTWALNRRFTFASGRRWAAEYGSYIAVQTVGALVNLTVYTGCIQAVAAFRDHPVAALAAGSAVALVANYCGAERLVFRPRQRDQQAPVEVE